MLADWKKDPRGQMALPTFGRGGTEDGCKGQRCAVARGSRAHLVYRL